MKKIIFAVILAIMCSSALYGEDTQAPESKFFVNNLNKVIQEYENLTKEVSILKKSLELEQTKVKDLTEKNLDLENYTEILLLERGDFKSKLLSLEAQIEEIKTFIRRKGQESYKVYEDKIVILTQELNKLKDPLNKKK
ncbi:MAG: hypothetical protein HQL29_04185 [Candidatus Omnitrophica bacterium]|nr:hypothetical protein [Candidatus Omnitrophota bacterium]